MSRYDWPHVTRREMGGDDPGARGRLKRQIQTDFDPEGARAASVRAVQPPHPPPGVVGPFAAPTVLQHLWQPLGPIAVLRGQAIGDPRIAGRVNMLAVHPGGQRVYAASANGGVWYTNDGGVTWKSLGGFASTTTAEIVRPAQRHTCGSIAVSFGATENGDTVYVGTGEHTHDKDAQPGHSLGGIGILVADHPATNVAVNPWTREAKNLLGRGVCRIAIQPSPGTGVVVATTGGLVQRPAPGVDNEWLPVAGKPFSTLTDKCADVLWTKGDSGTGRPERLWVWVQAGDKGGLWVRDAGAADFTKIATPGAMVARAVLAAAEPPDQIFLFNDTGQTTPPVLFRVACATAATPVATQVVAGVPSIFGKQGFYDIALAVHPAKKDRVVVGGSTFNATAPDGTAMNQDAAVVTADVGNTAAGLTFGLPAPGGLPSTMVGVGAHADVHDLAYSNNGDRLWLACDGGVYRSDKPTTQVSFFPVNDGLSIIESNYIANHPTCEGYVVAGLQDNGVVGRRSTGVWKLEGYGDGGGVAFDPMQTDRYVRQYVQGTWYASDGSIATPFTGDKAAFYSMPAAIAHRRGAPAPPDPNIGQIIVGTNRVWYTEDFGAKWHTLPKGQPPPAGDTSQDDFGELIRVCRWQSPDVAWILSEGILQRYARTAGSDIAKGPGSWTGAVVIKKSEKNKKDATKAEGPIRDSAVWTDIAVNLDPPAAAGQPPVPHGTLGAVYLGTIGKPDDDKVDTLWWFDGTSKWFPTGLRKKAVPAPVTAIACDFDHPDEVWIGTTVGVWRGVRTLNGANPPTWTFEGRVNGLPEAAVEDLAIFKDGSLRLLRAGIASRGVWELRLDVSDLVEVTYLRAHEDDLRYRVRAVEKKRDRTTDRSWHGSPDVRPRRAALPILPTNFPWIRGSSKVDAEALRRFQCALRARTGDQRVRPTGTWDVYFNEVLRDLGAPLAPSPPDPPNTVSIDKDFWKLSMKPPFDVAEAWGAGVPSEADLYDFAAQLSEGDVAHASSVFPGEKLTVDVVVHRRGLDAVDGTNVRVTLLQWIDPKSKNAAKWDDPSTWFTGNVPWTAAVNQVLNSADGKTNTALTNGWAYVLGDATKPRRVTLGGQILDAMHPGIASFPINLVGAKKNLFVMLVAVIRVGTTAADDIALAPATVRDLALTSPSVAVRSMRINPQP